MNISALYQIFLRHPKITTDSRNCPKDGLFFALRGESFDGNEFALKALQEGCAYAVIDNPLFHIENRTILVDNVLSTLQCLARLHRQSLGTPLIGITGTNGKTTTKELISKVLSKKFNTLYTQGNFNNHIGVPLTLLRLNTAHEIAVIEMGANHPGEIHALVQIACPDYGIITNVGYAHLEGFGSFEGVVRTKGELYDYLRATHGKIFINQENEHLAAISQGLEKITYGTQKKESTFIYGEITEHHPFLSLKWMQEATDYHAITTNLVGDYNLWNVLAAITIGRYFGVDADDICQAIAAYTPTNYRSQWCKTANNELIIDAYNANPSSMKAALDNFSSLNATPKAVILGDMRELGEESKTLHAAVVEHIRSINPEKVLLCGENFMAVNKGFECCRNIEELRELLLKKTLRGYHILIKGSHGTHLERILDML